MSCEILSQNLCGIIGGMTRDLQNKKADVKHAESGENNAVCHVSPSVWAFSHRIITYALTVIIKGSCVELSHYLNDN